MAAPVTKIKQVFKVEVEKLNPQQEEPSKAFYT